MSTDRELSSLSVEAWATYVAEPCPVIDPNTIAPVTWSDEYFSQNFEIKAFIKDRPSLEMLKSYAKLFLNFYVYAAQPAKIDEVFLGLISGMKTKEDLHVTPQFLYNERGMTLTPGTASKMEETASWTSSCQGVIAGNMAAGASNSGVVPSGAAAPVSLAARDVWAWYSLVWGWIEGSVATDPDSVERFQYAINLLGFLAIQLIRTVVKDKNDVARHILGYSYKRVEHFWGPMFGFSSVVPPHDIALSTMCNSFDRFSVGGTKVLAMLVSAYLRAPVDGGVNIKAILKAGCLLGLSGVGLGCIMWLMKASGKAKSSLKEMQAYMACSKFDRTNLAIIKFMRKLGDSGDKIKTWPWARLFTDGAYQDLATKSDPEYAGIMMAVTIGANPTDEMWKIPQFAGQFNPVNIRICCNYAQAILEDVLVPSVDSTMTSQARVAVTGLQRLEQSQVAGFAAPQPRNQPDDNEFGAAF